MDLETEKKKKKPRKVARRKTLRREKTEHVEEITNRVGGLKVEASPMDQSRSQPSSRRGSTLPSALLLNPGELTRRASNAVMTDLPDLGSRRGSQVVDPERRGEVTRRGSVKRGSISWEQEDQMESKKLKAALEAMGMMKKKQKEFLWDSVNSSSSKEESGEVRVGNLSNPAASQMTKDQALKTLGLAHTQSKGKFSKPKNVTDYSEQEILTAFQNECKSLTSKGKVRELQNCHEAYQVLLKVIKAKNNFMKRSKAKKEKQARVMVQVEEASQRWIRRSSLLNVE